MSLVALILNLPWTALGLIGAVLSMPTSVHAHYKPLAVVVTVRSFWWLSWLPGYKGIRATTLGNVVLLGSKLLPHDLEHELVHVEQNEREPLIKPFLYTWQSLKYGYHNNKYEVEAYRRAGNMYVPKAAETTYVLYFNGLADGTTRKREQLAINYLAKRNIQVEHVPIHWRSDESFESLLERMTKFTKERLKTHGKIVLVGSSAGGSLVVNILGQLHDKNLYGVTLCSRLHEAPLPWWDKRTLKRMAHVGGKNQSQAFFDSVTYCGKTTIQELTNSTKQRLVITQQWADFVVPRQTMSIPGVRTYKVPGLGHGWGIAVGVRRLPKIIRRLDV